MKTIGEMMRDIRAKAIVRRADKYFRKHKELSYQQAFCMALEDYGLQWTDTYRRWSE